MHNNNKRAAFTLAEALITLVILGVIASLTVPGLKRYSQKETAAMQLKKAYTTMNQALDYALADSFSINIDKIDADAFFLQYVVPRLNAVKQCDNTNMDECFAPDIDGLTINPLNAVVLSDGSAIASNGRDYIVDTNAFDGPNISGVDVYVYKMAKVKGDNQEDDGTEDVKTSGWKFVPEDEAAEIMNNNWKIKHW